MRTRVREFRAAGPVDREDRLATEEPLEVRCAWPSSPARRVAVTMRTPGHDFELAAGFLYAEGVLGGSADLHRVAYCTDTTLSPEQEFNVVTVDLAGPPRSMPAERYAGAVRGLLGLRGLRHREHRRRAGPARRRARAAARPTRSSTRPWCTRCPTGSATAQKVFDSTGGLHAAGLFSADGEALVVREDIGRHNAVDKVVGSRLLAGEPTGTPVLAVSGRIGFEIVQKAVAAGVGVLAAVGAPSSLAVDLARRAGLCTIGFVGPETVRHLRRTGAARRVSRRCVGGRPYRRRVRILHTSDWHLGRSFHRVGLLDAQATFVDHLLDTVERRGGRPGGRLRRRLRPGPAPGRRGRARRRDLRPAGRLARPGRRHQRQPRLPGPARLQRPPRRRGRGPPAHPLAGRRHPGPPRGRPRPGRRPRPALPRARRRAHGLGPRPRAATRRP